MGISSVDRSTIPPLEMAKAYKPIMMAYIGPALAYNVLIGLSHPFYEKGWYLIILESLAVLAILLGLILLRTLKRSTVSIARLEVVAVCMNSMFLTNVIAYQTVHFEAAKLVYFVLLGLIFATAAPTWRTAGLSVLATTTALMMVARDAPGDVINHYGFIGLAGAFAALGMSFVVRGAVTRELRARLVSEALNKTLESELAENRALRAKAEELTLRAQAASRAKSEFLAIMSHEIRTPLNGVLGMAQVMQQSALPDAQKRRLDVIQSSGQSLLRVINAILDISRIEAGQMEAVVAPFSLDEVADDLRRLYVGLALEKGLALNVAVDPGVAGWRIGDSTLFRQVLSNLISNAIKFTDTGRVSLRFSGDDARLVCCVQDTGCGIPETHRDRVFDRFVQVDGSNTRRADGSGLGLAICKEIVTLLGGQIDVQSAAGGGTRFTVDLPFPVTDRQEQGETEVAPPALEAALRVLVVDDVPTNRHVIEAMLGALGVTCGAATNGRDAIDQWESGDWDAILMDIHMPTMDGLDASREIRAREAMLGRTRIPIIAVTASVMSHETDQYLAAGCDSIVAKPVELRKLTDALAISLPRPADAGGRPVPTLVSTAA